MTHPHAAIITAMGTLDNVAEQVNAKRGSSRAVSLHAVDKWKQRGIPWRHRPTVRDILADRDMAHLIPQDF